jgi:hypothetical protein
MAEAPTPTGVQAPDIGDKKKAEFFAAVRARGVLNTMLDGPALAFEANNPGWRTRWEYAPPNGDPTFVVAREAMGFRTVDAAEIGEKTASEQKSGVVRRGDLILLAAPEHIVNAIEMEDARVAYEDWKLPETSYREHLKSIRARLRDGTEKGATPIGSIKQHEEVVEVSLPQQRE